jgi:hypothetical protein
MNSGLGDHWSQRLDMIRSLPLVTAAIAAISLPAYAADYWEDSKPGYAWDETYEDDLDVEIGLRYWYSMGAHNMTVMGGNYSQSDSSHILEGNLRVDDHASNFYGKVLLGYSAVITGTYTTPAGGPIATQSGRLAYVGGDIGVVPSIGDSFGVGGFAGYMFWNDSPDMGRVNYAGGSLPNDLNYHVVRLGVAAKAEVGPVELWAEAAAVPYANLSGTYGALSPPLLPGETQTSAGTISSPWLYGAMGEVMARFHPTEHWTIGVGGRAWYLTGQADVRFTSTLGNWVTKTTNFSTLRYGLLGEVTYKF